MHHPRSDVDRIYLPRKDGGRGLMSITTSYEVAMVGLECYLSNQEDSYLSQVYKHEEGKKKYSIVKTSKSIIAKCNLEVPTFLDQQFEPSKKVKALKIKVKTTIKEMKKEKWESKPLHGQYPKTIDKPYVDQESTNCWLAKSDLKGETESLITAAQDQALKTRNYQKYILGQDIDSTCRLCQKNEETIDHILSGCEVLAKREYLQRHNNVASYIHWHVCKDNGIEVDEKWYQHQPTGIVKQGSVTIFWDYPVTTDRTIPANRPDIIIKNNESNVCQLIDISVPSDRNICLKYSEKKTKYKDLEIEVCRMWKKKTEVLPVIVGALGTIKKGSQEILDKISKNIEVSSIQKITLLGSAHIIRKFGL